MLFRFGVYPLEVLKARLIVAATPADARLRPVVRGLASERGLAGIDVVESHCIWPVRCAGRHHVLGVTLDAYSTSSGTDSGSARPCAESAERDATCHAIII